MAQFFGQGGGMPKVDEHENSFFFFGFLGFTKKGIPKDPGAEFFVDRTESRNEVGRKEEQDNLDLNLVRRKVFFDGGQG